MWIDNSEIVDIGATVSEKIKATRAVSILHLIEIVLNCFLSAKKDDGRTGRLVKFSKCSHKCRYALKTVNSSSNQRNSSTKGKFGSNNWNKWLFFSYRGCWHINEANGSFPLYWPSSLVCIRRQGKEALSAGSTVITVIRSRQGTKQAFNLTLLTQVQARDNMIISMQYAYEHSQMRFLQGKNSN